MVFLSPQICLQASSRALSTDPGGLRQCGKHCHLLGLLTLPLKPSPGALNVSTSATRAAFSSDSQEELLNCPEYRDNQLGLVFNL